LKYLIVGLGNIGDEYAQTRHNIGFKVLDAWVKASNISFEQKRLAYYATDKHKGRNLILIKPTTYMNLSGKAINYWLQQESIPVENLFIIVDDIALPFGTVRIKSKGSDGGHNGLSHIIETLKHNNFSRLRFGIGNQFSQGRQVDYVLGNWSAEEEKILPPRIELMIEAAKSFSTLGIERTMNFFNNK